ncbi:MAG TPA: TauD/TfdA family dioxygenase [Burkholderiaceae bacterium]|nr:TauD/TfdA family dioxygenase [Burkholderiaceae bacterium]
MSKNNPFDINNQIAYAKWRDTKLERQPQSPADLIVDVKDPRNLSADEKISLLKLCGDTNMAIYRSPMTSEDKNIPRLLASQLGMKQLDCNWLADEDGISPIAVANTVESTTLISEKAPRRVMIPYTNLPIKWHTDGYYQPTARNINGMVLHCVRPALSGGETAVIDHDMVYIALREANPNWVAAFMANDAMTIPARTDDDGVARAEQTGPVFSVADQTRSLHMRYTARKRSIAWKNNPVTQEAVQFLEKFLASDTPSIFRLKLEPGMGLVCNNVLHDRTGFTDDPDKPRLLYRARFLDRVSKFND